MQVSSVTDKGGLEMFVRLLESESSQVHEQAIWALANMAGDHKVLRDRILRTGALKMIVKIVANTQERDVIQHGIWCLSNLCRGSDKTQF